MCLVGRMCCGGLLDGGVSWGVVVFCMKNVIGERHEKWLGVCGMKKGIIIPFYRLACSCLG